MSIDMTQDRSRSALMQGARVPAGAGTRLRALTAALLAVIVVLGLLAASAQASNKRANGEVIATCTSVTFVYTGFPEANNNMVHEKIFVHGTLVYEGEYSFNGTTGSNTIPVTVPAGLGMVDGRASWDTNGFRSGFDIATALNCSKPAFTIEKEQEVEGSGEGFTTQPVVAGPGKTVLYKITVKNTGNTPLTFGALTDTHCSGLTGGPTGPLAPGESATYFCSHTIVEADEKAETYENSATVTATPPKGEGSTVKHTSNTVVVKFPSPHERPNGEVSATCSSITFTYRKFPNLPNNTVTEKVFVHGELILTKLFHFNGPSGSDTIAITVPPGIGMVDGRAKWNTNGFQGGWDVAIGIRCNATPSFTIEKLQKVHGSAEPFTSAPVSSTVGGQLDYQITVKNTGNVPLTFSSFTDTNCSGVAGGPAGQVPVGGSATYTCSHVLTLADANHEYDDSATVTATPPGEPSITHTSNTVDARVPFTAEPGFALQKTQHVAGQPGSFTTGAVSAVRGETIEYEVVATNTGNVPLRFSDFSDTVCDGGTTSGGPGEAAVEPGASTTYKCTHLVTPADEEAGQVTNVASDTGTPPEGFGSAASHESNSVTANIAITPAPALQLTKEQRANPADSYTSEPLSVPSESTLEYQIEVKNTGNVTLTLSRFTDPVCDEGTLSTEPGEPTLAPGATRVYTCSHQLPEADGPGTRIDNVASDTGTPPEGQGAPVEGTSNEVVTEVS